MAVEPIPDEPAASVETGDERILAVADYHAGIEQAIREEDGLSVPSRAERRRETILDLVNRTAPDRLVVIGDVMHSIGGPGGAERGEIEVLVESLDVPVTVVRGNHDGAIDAWLPAGASIADSRGIRIGSVGFVHGHTWPAPEVLSAEAVCIGHEHPCVHLTDPVGGSRVERAWVRGELSSTPFEVREEYADVAFEGDLVVFPAFNDLSGGTWVNEDPDFLCPFLPGALRDGEAFLLDGTRLGPYDQV